MLASPLASISCNVVRLVPTVWLYGYQSHPIADRFHDVSRWIILPLAFRQDVSLVFSRLAGPGNAGNLEQHLHLAKKVLYARGRDFRRGIGLRLGRRGRRRIQSEHVPLDDRGIGIVR